MPVWCSRRANPFGPRDPAPVEVAVAAHVDKTRLGEGTMLHPCPLHWTHHRCWLVA